MSLNPLRGLQKPAVHVSLSSVCNFQRTDTHHPCRQTNLLKAGKVSWAGWPKASCPVECRSRGSLLISQGRTQMRQRRAALVRCPAYKGWHREESTGYFHRFAKKMTILFQMPGTCTDGTKSRILVRRLFRISTRIDPSMPVEQHQSFKSDQKSRR